MVDKKPYQTYFKSPLGWLRLEENGGRLAVLLSIEKSGQSGGESGVSKGPVLSYNTHL